MPNANDGALKITLEGTTYEVDDFELGELEWIEDQLGMSIDEATAMKQAVAFVAVIKRRENPDFTLEDARKIKLRAIDQQAPNGNGAGARPTKAARKSASARGGSGATS